MLVRFQDAGVAISASAVMCGSLAAFYNTKNAIKSLRKLKEEKDRSR